MPHRFTVTASARALTFAAACSLVLGMDTPFTPDAAFAHPRCAALATAVLEDARVISAAAVRDGAWAPPSGRTVSDLPPFCHVQGLAAVAPRSRIGFEVWLPLEGWSGRIHMVGNGGYSSSIRRNLLGALIRRGDAAVATDTGHQGHDLSFGFDNRDAIEDWSHRAVHYSIRSGKALAEAFYGQAPRFSYFSGCSTGGHQGLMSAQRYPDDFDGIIAGAPGNNRTNLNFGFLWQFVSNRAPGDDGNPILSPDDLRLVSQAVMSRCDGLDGLEDGILADPRRCRFDPGVLRCAPGRIRGCLTAPKIEALARMYGGARRADTGEIIYPGWPLGSEFVEGQGLSEGWHGYWANPQRPDEPQRIDYFRRWVFDDPDWDWREFDWVGSVDEARAVMGPLVDATDTALGDFRARGGKLILFTGWQDPVVSAHDVIAYYDGVADARGGSADDFARLFLVPGMGHCALGAGATNFSTSTRNSAPLRPDAEHDVTRALERWVEEGLAPEHIIAARYPGGDPASGAEMTRPLCPYPRVPTYDGQGDPSRADSFTCR